MDPGDEIRLREIQREYLDFLDDDVIIVTLIYIYTMEISNFLRYRIMVKTDCQINPEQIMDYN